MEKTFECIEGNRKRNLDRYIECLKMETISAKKEKVEDIRRCGEWLVELLGAMGMENSALKETGGLPAVYAEWLGAGEEKPTILVYGHFDVQPPEPLEKWNTPPFEPTIKDGFIYARGANDDKGQFLAHIFALEAILKEEGGLPVNVKVFIESEEEGGPDTTNQFVRDNKDLLACDAVVLSDGSWPSAELPTISYALRGIAYFDVRLAGPNRDLHSGMYGGVVQNPLNAMAKIIAGLHDGDGRIAISGIYDDVIPLTDRERKEFAKVGISDDDIRDELGVDGLWSEKGYSAVERNWARPSLDVNGIWGGYMGEGAKTVIAAECGFKLSIRLVPDQDPKKVCELVTGHIGRTCPRGVKAKVDFLSGGSPLMISPDHPLIGCASSAMEKAFGRRPVLVREGGSVPITATFRQALGAPSILLNLGLAGDNIHSPNEHFRLENFYKGIEACAHFYIQAAQAGL